MAGLGVACAGAAHGRTPEDDVRRSIEAAHREIRRRFIDPRFHLLYDYAGLGGEVHLPTPGECAEDKPNALAWWCPAENGAFFGGLYLDALCNRWRATRDAATADEAARIAAGLERLGSVGSAPGFIARGVADDGASHHVAGSDDQTLPWLYGLWRYLKSGLPDERARRRLSAKVVAVGEALHGCGWRMPCDRPGFGFRGTWAGPEFVHAARLLFAQRALYDLTDERAWLERYRASMAERPAGSPLTRLELCNAGMPFEPPGGVVRYPENPPFWTSASSQAALKALFEMEEDEGIRARYRQGLDTTARHAAPHIRRYASYDNDNTLAFVVDWRFLNDLWTPQANPDEAVRVAMRQVREWDRRSPRRHPEAVHMREPLFAAWIVALSGDAELVARWRADLHGALCHYRWERLYTSLFFAAEGAYYEGLRHGL